MEYNDFNWNLAQRFANDYRLPIPIICDNIFFHHLFTYEEDLHAWTKWCQTVDLINMRFDGDVNAFLDDFYKVRDNIIKDIKVWQPYIDFTEMDMSQFAVDHSKYKTEGKGCYNENNIGRKLISIDLAKANFQAMKYVNPNILKGAKTYDELIGMYTDSPYIINSKYIRQVIFGQWNPGRQATIEKYLICKVLDHIIEAGKVSNRPVNIISINADEVILEDDGAIIPELFVPMVFEKFGIEIHVERLELEGYNFYSNRENHHRFTFYVKNGDMMCVPGPYYAITHKLYNNEVPSALDYHFNYENIDCVFNDTFRIEKIDQ